MFTERASGVLLHPSSLPGPYGIGDLGERAAHWIDWLADAGQSCWQILPLNPTDDEFSPYLSPSTFAGNPLLLGIDALVADGLVHEGEARGLAERCGTASPEHVDFAAVAAHKRPLVERAAERLLEGHGAPGLRSDCETFCREQGEWLDHHALYMAGLEANDGRSWCEWTECVGEDRRPTDDGRSRLAHRSDVHRAVQFLFARQWAVLRERAHRRGVRILGDLPIYVSHRSADVWGNRSLFQLDERGLPRRVAGVPPDYFSSTGQLWGNPLYDWEESRRTGHAWWVRRVRTLLGRVDLLRLDHFRGLQAYWAVPAEETTARNGNWEPGPSDGFFAALQTALLSGHGANGQLPILAEDLGHITEDVTALRHRFGLPGMKVLQFAMGIPGDPFDPGALERDCVVYTGTHDNDTTAGWFRNEILPDGPRLEHVRRYTPGNPEQIAWELLEVAWRSSAGLAIAPLQDVLSLGSESRMNKPGTTRAEHANWSWRASEEQLAGAESDRLRALTEQSGRRTTRS